MSSATDVGLTDEEQEKKNSIGKLNLKSKSFLYTVECW